MKTSLFNFIRTLTNLGEKDVFQKTQGRLTRIYSGLLILFLALFILIVYSVLYVVILKNQERDLQSLVNQEAGFIENYLSKNEQGNLRGMQNQEVVFAGVNQFFYYVVNANGEVLMGNEDNPRLRPELLRIVGGAEYQNSQKVHKETLHLEEYPMGRGKKSEFRPHEVDSDIRLMITNEPIYQNGQYIGQLYIGKDISFAYQLFRWLFFILAVIGIVFFGVALYLSVVMSKRAMIPVTHAFTRQREFVADASHELRTPLSVLLSSLDAMEMTLEPKKEDFAGKMLAGMRQEVRRMTNLVSDLLTLARSDSNTIQLRRETFDFRAQAEKAIESLCPLAASKNISLHLQVPDELLAVGDPDRLSQLLYILLDNAIKYTSDEGEVKLSLEKTEHHVLIAVQDTGIGIKQEDYQRIFERFYRADKSRSRQMGGHGLGLSIAKWIVDTHKGTIKVSSEIGKGSTFMIQIPQKNQ